MRCAFLTACDAVLKHAKYGCNLAIFWKHVVPTILSAPLIVSWRQIAIVNKEELRKSTELYRRQELAADDYGKNKTAQKVIALIKHLPCFRWDSAASEANFPSKILTSEWIHRQFSNSLCGKNSVVLPPASHRIAAMKTVRIEFNTVLSTTALWWSVL